MRHLSLQSYLYLKHACFPSPCEVIVAVIAITITTIPVPNICINSNSLTSYDTTGVINEGTNGVLKA